MALFKIEKGLKDNLMLNRPTTQEGWCYFTIDDGKFYIDIESEKNVTKNPESRVCLNAARADYLVSNEKENIITNSSIQLDSNNIIVNSINTIDLSAAEDINNFIIKVKDDNNAFTVTNENGESITSVSHNQIKVNNTIIGEQVKLQQDSKTTTIKNDNISIENSTSAIINEPGKLTVNNNGDSSTIIGSQFSGNAASADKLNTNAGSLLHPIYFSDGKPVQTTYDLDIAGTKFGLVKSGGNVTISNGIINVKDDEHNHIINNIDGLQDALDSKMDKNAGIDGYLPLTAGEDYKLTGPLGLTDVVNYGNELPSSGFEGQLFFLEAENTMFGLPSGGSVGQILVKSGINDGVAEWQTLDIGGNSLPDGGSKGQALIKNSNTNGDASWQDIVALPKGGVSGQILTKTGQEDGEATWQDFPSLNYLPVDGTAVSAQKLATARTISLSGDVTGSANFDGSGNITIKTTNKASTAPVTTSSITFSPDAASTNGGYLNFNYPGYSNQDYTSRIVESSAGSLEVNNVTISNGVVNASQVYGAVYNDYAEYREQEEVIKPGYCVASTDNGKVYKTIEKFQPCEGIVSDTFGFAIGETDNCKTPLAVAGRVLAYCEGDYHDYHAGDTVCAGPEGKVYKMTREEIREWPDRVVGIVSEIPEYETWGTNNIQVNGRIWITIK